MSGRQITLPYQFQHIFGQVQKPQQVRNMASTFTQGFSHFFLRVPETIHQLPIPCSLFNRVEVRTLNVFDNRDFKNFNVGKFADNDRQLVQLSHLGRTPAPFTGNNLEGSVLAAAHD